ncbi:extracellular catalytic domain type 1 short-chain-length polyhydroxyalkanoate depolymerase [Sphingosinicella terrae]|uniref:extracellular catalytic domain type 1 short-chain-length polyhydroxyalkanoate depolymerase n=1 Tax=Sphingosinicella terrae TaxID=2172047 RepID=UPI0025495F31|nr:PHB depolymerase family esterase [Sphingosinicella terrae]
MDRLTDLGPFANNPGHLTGRYHVPETAKGSMPLVVVLHGCTQNAAVYDQGSGWSALADRHGFALLFPEQSRDNNPMLCFNWFSANHSQRGMGEAASIRAMIDAMRRTHDIDPDRIFVTGLSAGGAMASVMLATYPETFAAGAIIAGVAYGCASGVAEAFECMNGRTRGGARELGDRIRRASPHRGTWPRIQVWQGNADRTVVASNADAIVLQWTDVHGLPPQPSRNDIVAGHPRRAWTGADGKVLVEHYELEGMAHGVPLDPGTAEGQSGEVGAHMLDVGLSSTDTIAAFFGIAPEPQASPARPATVKAPAAPVGGAGAGLSAASGVQKTIEEALRSAGLLK